MLLRKSDVINIMYLVWSKYRRLFFLCIGHIFYFPCSIDVARWCDRWVWIYFSHQVSSKTVSTQISRKFQIWMACALTSQSLTVFFFQNKNRLNKTAAEKPGFFTKSWEKFRFIWTLLTFLFFRKLKASFLLNMQPIISKLPSKRRKVSSTRENRKMTILVNARPFIPEPLWRNRARRADDNQSSNWHKRQRLVEKCVHMFITWDSASQRFNCVLPWILSMVSSLWVLVLVLLGLVHTSDGSGVGIGRKF